MAFASLAAPGGNGSFTDEEMKSATAIAAKHIDGRVSLVAGTGARTTSACITLSKHARRCRLRWRHGLAGLVLAVDDRGVFDHYERVARSIKIPICIYNNPWTTGVDMKPELLARLTELDNCNCIKESTGDLTRITGIRLLTKDRVTMIAGWEVEQFAGLHGRRDRVGAGLHQLRAARSP